MGGLIMKSACIPRVTDLFKFWSLKKKNGWKFALLLHSQLVHWRTLLIPQNRWRYFSRYSHRKSAKVCYRWRIFQFKIFILHYTAQFLIQASDKKTETNVFVVLKSFILCIFTLRHLDFLKGYMTRPFQYLADVSELCQSILHAGIALARNWRKSFCDSHCRRLPSECRRRD